MNYTFQSRSNCVVVLRNVLAVAEPMGLVTVLALLSDVLWVLSMMWIPLHIPETNEKNETRMIFKKREKSCC